MLLLFQLLFFDHHVESVPDLSIFNVLTPISSHDGITYLTKDPYPSQNALFIHFHHTALPTGTLCLLKGPLAMIIASVA